MNYLLKHHRIILSTGLQFHAYKLCGVAFPHLSAIIEQENEQDNKQVNEENSCKPINHLSQSQPKCFP